MDTDLSIRIEVWLLTQTRWVTADELCQRFEVNERALRGHNEIPGLVTEFTVSGDRGYLHVRYASKNQLDRFAARLRANGIGQLKRVKRIRAAWVAARTGGSPPVELHTGQTLLPIRA